MKGLSLAQDYWFIITWLGVDPGVFDVKTWPLDNQIIIESLKFDLSHVDKPSKNLRSVVHVVHLREYIYTQNFITYEMWSNMVHEKTFKPKTLFIQT